MLIVDVDARRDGGPFFIHVPSPLSRGMLSIGSDTDTA